MHRALAGRWLNRALSINEASALRTVPVFLCPAVGYGSRLTRTPLTTTASRYAICAKRLNHTETTATPTLNLPSDAGSEVLVLETSEESSSATSTTAQEDAPVRKLPMTCSGCGAFTQTSDPQLFGYFDLEHKRIKKWMYPHKYAKKIEASEADQLVDEVLKTMDQKMLDQLGLNIAAMKAGEESQGAVVPVAAPEKQPVCERCHNLVHHSTKSDTAKIEMHHPTVESLRETIEESPHKYNHIYHVVDAADFPMSLIPRLNVLLGDIPMRTRNRRSRSGKYIKDRQTELSFIITRSDLLGPTKEIVDGMMPYLREELRDALGRLGGRVRLGNVRCVSATRAWWTKVVKEDIWNRGGAGWLVGKVNVGKSQLFEAVYPKGRMGTPDKPVEKGRVETYSREMVSAESIADVEPIAQDVDDVDVGDLLPPPQPARNYPDMPVVSPLPGTTASPIRIPFGNGKGELIDLPGLARSNLDLFVKEEYRQSMIMKKRIVPEQISAKSHQSLILGGGLIRITPRSPNTVFLMYNFTPLDDHLTQTDKAVAFQEQTRLSSTIENIALPGVGEKMKHAGTFELKHDVTKQRAGPLTRRSAVGLSTDRLPFKVLSTDILIEGVGYVEIVAQVRAKDVNVQYERRVKRVDRRGRELPTLDSSDPFAALEHGRRDASDSFREKVEQVAIEPEWPAIDVFSPEGRFIGSRRPLNGWLNNKPRVRPEHKRSRPRKSMKGQKKKEKYERRASE